ncbi:glycoside hydrolase family 105 protein [Ammoniphilus sp. YIM 78166]|uniref:glycoside hydrolase family 88/105 protein n=1 Tax=Ammoniphilus sp. YIM 78166 TaxID=1644106 RepID=UPI00106FC5AF|nr:glycoside hydrolase family 88 protein [Ammoniphilus sp. YIM 78166]
MIDLNVSRYLEIAEQACQELMKTYSPSELPPANHWHYHQGVFLYGMQRVWEKTGKEEYFQYIKAYIDLLVDEEGNFLFDRDQLDSIQVGILLFPLLERTEDKRYQIAADKLRNLFHTLNKTSEGGFWHKDKYPYQMWLDGLYMEGPFALLYSRKFNQPELVDMVVYQGSLMRSHMKHETGLLFHAWDEKKAQPWANKETGCSPEFWGRSVGWYGTALVDILELMPEDHPGRADFIQSLQDYVRGLAQFQDEKTGLWYQVVDKGDRADNWLESSCTSLFVYTIAKAVEAGYIDAEYLKVAQKAYQGLLDHMIVSEEGKWIMKGICIGTSAGDYDYYVGRPTSENDLHGVGAFILATMALEKLVGREA